MNESSVNILIVDDRADKLLALEAVLEELGQTIICVNSGREALRQLLQREFAVILLDVNMPGMDGFETAQMIRERPASAGVPIIFLTAMGDDMHVARSYSLGAVDYMLTPVVPQVLRSKVSVLVELFQKNQQVRRQADRLRQRATQLHQLTTASISINSAPTVERVIQVATETAREIVETHQAITFATPGGYPSRPINFASYSDKYAEWRKKTPQPGNPSLRALLTRDGKPVRMVQLELETQVPQMGTKDMPPLRGLLAVQLTDRDGREMGFILLSDKIDGEFTDDDQAVLMQLAQMASVAVENVKFAAEREDHRAKEEFLSTLSHELRTPLTAISGWIQLLQREDLDPNISHAVKVIERNVHAQQKLIEDLLDLSRISTGKLRLSCRHILLRPLLEGSIEALRPMISSRGINLVCDLDGFNPAVSGDPDRLQQVFSNLIGNAAKFTPAGGTISVGLQITDGVLKVTISDTGEGIDSEFLPFIFHRFRQADSSSSRRHGGLGIGLTIVRHLIELHRGTVTAQSPGKGLGSAFTVTIPVAVAELPAPVSTTDQDDGVPLIQGLHVLLVDDDPDTLDVVGRILRGHQATVVSAASAREAMQALASFKPDVLVTDLGLPEQDGYALLRAIRALGANQGDHKLPVIALTAYAGGDDRHRALQAGFQEHLPKPVNARDLINAIGRFANGRGKHSKVPSAKASVDANIAATCP